MKSKMKQAKTDVAKFWGNFWELYYATSMMGVFVLAVWAVRSDKPIDLQPFNKLGLLVVVTPIAVEGAIKFYRLLSKGE